MMDLSLDSAALHEVAWRARVDTFAEKISDGKYKSAPVHQFMAKICSEAIVKGNARLIINLPPGSGKSTMFSFWLPTWYLEHLPNRRCMICANTADLAEDWGRMVRDEFNSNEKLSTRLRDDVKSASKWHTQRGGQMFCAGVGGSVVGRRYDLAILDDPYSSWKDAYSPVVRRDIAQWFDSAFWTRKEPGASIILVMHRFHSEDLTGYLVKSNPGMWTVVNIPAIAHVGDAMGRKSGESFWPERFPVDDLQATQKRNSIVWSAMYDQEPMDAATGRCYDHFVNLPFKAGNIIGGTETAALQPRLPLLFAIDFNVNPGVHVELSQYDPRSDFGWTRHELFEPRARTERIMERFESLMLKLGGFRWPELWVMGDRSGNSPSTNTTDTDYDIIKRKLTKMGIKYRILVPLKNPPIKGRVETVNDALRDDEGFIHWIIHPSCERLIRDFSEIVPDEDGQPDKSNQELTHPSDGFGYMLWRLRPVKRAKMQSIVAAI